MDLEQDIRDQVIAELPHDQADRDTLLSMDINSLLVRYFNWRDRFIPPVPRRVHWSAALRANPLATSLEYRAALEQVAADVADGTDLRPQLSRSVAKGFINKPGLDRQDLDLLLNDWGMHHLHLSTELQQDNYVARTKHLLFAIFRPGDAYFIDIFPHVTSWAEERVLRIMRDEWPDADLLHGPLPGGLVPLVTYVNSERLALRRKGLMVGITIDGAFYFPRDSFMASGVSERHVDAADKVCRALPQVTLLLEQDPDFVVNAVSANSIALPEQPDVHLLLLDAGRVGLIERQTNVAIPL